MVIIKADQSRYACEPCIRGHRISTCSHENRALKLVKSRGRPATQCKPCRDNRRNLGRHVKCHCGGGREKAEGEGSMGKTKSKSKTKLTSSKGKEKEKEIDGPQSHRELGPDIITSPKCKCDQGGELCICCNEKAASSKGLDSGDQPEQSSSRSRSSSSTTKKRKLRHGTPSLDDVGDGKVETISSASNPSRSLPTDSSDHQNVRSSCCSSSNSNRYDSIPSVRSPHQQLIPTFDADPIEPSFTSTISHDDPSRLFLLSDSISPPLDQILLLEDPDPNPRNLSDLEPSNHSTYLPQDPLELAMNQIRSEIDCTCGENCKCPGCFGLKKEIKNQDEEKSRISESPADQLDSLNKIGGESLDVKEVGSRGDSSKERIGPSPNQIQTSSSTSQSFLSKKSPNPVLKLGDQETGFFENCPTLCISCKGCDLSFENPWFGIPEVDDFMSASRGVQTALGF